MTIRWRRHDLTPTRIPLQIAAENISRSVQRSGDMMRGNCFALDKKIEYLTNYINRLKPHTPVLSNTGNVCSNTMQSCNFQAAPMFLIPFFENARKHGVSLKEKSWHRINIFRAAKYIYFDVYTSNNQVIRKTGIGSKNVKQYLLFIYPHTHELLIRATDKYFVYPSLRS